MGERAERRRGRASARVGGAWAVAAWVLGAAAVAAPAHAQERVALPEDDRALAPELEDVYTVGTLEGEDWEMFGGVSQVAFDAGGRLHVFDGDNSRVVVFRPDGTFSHQFGTRGGGPGEWQTPISMFVFADGRVGVMDIQARGLHVHGRDGTYLEKLGAGMDGGSLRFTPRMTATRDGRWAYSTGGGSIRLRLGGPGGASGEPAGRPVDRFDLTDDARPETFYTAWAPPPPEEVATRAGGIQFRMGQSEAFSPPLSVAVLPGGHVAVVDSTAYAVKIVAPGGEVERVLTRPVRPQRVTRRIEEAERKRRLDDLEEGDGPRMRVIMRGEGGGERSLGGSQMQEMMRERIESMTFRPEIPVIQEMAAGWGGPLWIRRAGDGREAGGPVDVVTPEGRYLGTLRDGSRIPAAFGPDGLAAYVERDELDVVRVEVKRLPAPLR